MRATFSLYPWDVEGDPRSAGVLRDLGVERVALAATYHAARVATPRHPDRRIVELPHSASYVAAPTPLPRGEFSFERARDALEAVGIVVDPWVVVNHLDGAAPDVPRVVTAFGDRVGHAACLSQAATRRYVTDLLGAVLPLAQGGRVVLEAVGWQGLGHGSAHDKLLGADFTARDVELLSLCLCDACLTAAGLGGSARAVVRAGVGAVTAAAGEPGIAPAVERGTAAGSRQDGDLAAVLGALRAARRATLAAVRRDAFDAAARAGIAEVRLSRSDADGDPAAEGVLVDCWGDVDAAVGRFDGLGRPGGLDGAPATRVGYVEVLARDLAGLDDDWRRLAAAGADELHVYHAGLASTPRVERAVRAAAAIDVGPRADRA